MLGWVQHGWLTRFYQHANIENIIMKSQLPVHPEEATKKLFSVLPKRTKDVLEKRFGLGKSTERMTLDAIGKGYGITRERVRQIEADGLLRVRKSDAIKDLGGVFAELENYFNEGGKVFKESHILSAIAQHPKHENHVYFLLSLHSPFVRFHENEYLHDRWAHGHNSHSLVEKTLSQTVSELRKIGKPIKEDALLGILGNCAKAVAGGTVDKNFLQNWLGVSKLISQNYFGEWGLCEFPEIKPRGVKDLSYMVLSRHGSPLHFSNVAQEIGKLVGKNAHVQTVHNELIKDQRFVLVGRGLYALKEWGYAPGMVKDVIYDTLKSSGPLNKEKIMALVGQKRLVKSNTIAINLENKKYFKKLSDGRYNITNS